MQKWKNADNYHCLFAAAVASPFQGILASKQSFNCCPICSVSQVYFGTTYQSFSEKIRLNYLVESKEFEN